MNITKAEFLMSNTRIDKLPNESLPEYAFIGRSNVGKSSLINMLAQRRGLANAVFSGFFDVVVPVDLRAFYSEKQTAFCGFSRVET